MTSFKEEVSGGMDVEKSSFTWTIDNFDVVRKSASLVRCQNFTIKTGESVGLPTDWRCSLKSEWRKPRKPRGNNEKIFWIGCHLFLQQWDEAYVNEVMANFKLTIKDSHEGIFYSSETKVRNFLTDLLTPQGWGFPCVIERNADLHELPLIDGCLVLALEIELYAPRPIPRIMNRLIDAGTHIAKIEQQYKNKFIQKLSEDLAKLLVNPLRNSDAGTTLLTQDKETFAVTRGILSARSPVFEKVFQKDTKESKESKAGIIQVTDISSKTMRVFLRFIYTGTLHNDWRQPDVITELIHAAGKYQTQDLLNFLDQVVGSLCTKETVGKLINLAKKFNMKTAEKELLEFVKKNVSSLDEMIAISKHAGAGIASDQGN